MQQLQALVYALPKMTAYLDTFPSWLRSLGNDTIALALVLCDDALSDDAARAVASGVNYLFKSLDIIPDGIDDIGYVDDAFVLRVCASQAKSEQSDALGEQAQGTLDVLAGDTGLIREFLGDDYERLDQYCKALRHGSARGRKVADIISDTELRDDFISDARGFAESFEAPNFKREEKNLKKLLAFFDAKLPQGSPV